jgi:hypothetical protein
MLRFNGRKWIELVFGLLPVTLVIGPLLPYAMLLITLPFLIGGAAGVSVLKFSDATLPRFVSVFAAALGLSALWVVFLLDPTKMRSRSKLFLVLGVALRRDWQLTSILLTCWFSHLRQTGIACSGPCCC